MRAQPNIHKLLPFFPLVLFVLNFITKILFLTSEEIALDEPFSIYHAQFPLPVLISILKGYNNPPLYEIILHFWIKLFGISPFSVRLLPMIFASLSPVALYYFARRNFSLQIAITSSLLLTFSYLLVYYSHDCRAYSLFVLLGLLSMHYYLETVIISRRTKLKTGLFLLFTTLLIYTHYFGFFLLFFQGLHLLFFFRKRIPVFLLFYFFILVFYLPHLYPFLTRAGDSVSHGTWIETPTPEGLYNSLWVFSNFPFITVACIVLLVAALVKFIMKPALPVDFHVTSLVVFWFLFAWLGMFLLSYFIPMYIHRYLIYALPAYYIFISLCINYLFKNARFGLFASTALVLCFIITLDYDPDKKQPVSEALKIIRENKGPQTMVLVYPYDLLPVFSYNYDREAFSSVSDNRQFFMTDSLLRSEKIFHIRDLNDLKTCGTASVSEILYFASGVQRNNSTDPVYQELTTSYELKWQKKAGANWYISTFEKHAAGSSSSR